MDKKRRTILKDSKDVKRQKNISSQKSNNENEGGSKGSSRAKISASKKSNHVNTRAADKKSSRKKSPRSKPFPIAAIGASAGGIEAVTELLKNLSPDTGMAFVYIQHLDPDHPSMLSSILAKATKMKVLEAEEHMRIEPDRFYIIPPNKEMLIEDGALTLNPRPAKPIISMPINRFFLSLAEKKKESAIGIVLSGNASDGTLGLRAIKNEGGFTFAQDDTAKFRSMPRAAIAEGSVDLVLSPKQIAAQLERLKDHLPLLKEEGKEKIPEKNISGNGEISSIIMLLKRNKDVDFTEYKPTTIRRRIVRRMLLHKMPSLREYYKYLTQHSAELQSLYDDLLINVTSFFRDEEAMNYLRRFILPKLLKSKSTSESLRIWVPACSTGEEAYSLAMLITEMLNSKSNRAVQIFASDLSENSITKARTGTYSKGEVTGISEKRLSRFFTPVDGTYRIIKSIRDMCVFAQHNLFKDPPFSRIDLISCCNLLIYLEEPLQKKLLITFHYALNAGGVLVLGKSETVSPVPQLFAKTEKKLKIFTARKNGPTLAASLQRTTTRTPDKAGNGREAASPEVKPERKGLVGIEKTVDNILLTSYAPASVVINKDMEILHFRGGISFFLEPSGRASLNLLKMARPGLGFELRNAVNKVFKSGKAVKKSGIEMRYRNSKHHVSIEVMPLKNGNDEPLYLIVFTEESTPVQEEEKTATAKNKRIRQLENELLASREDMRAITEEQEAVNEELQSANEEVVSSNEELQSINEELETSKEEIESTNEELMTINSELQIRNDQLNEAYDYADAVLATLREALIVLDSNLRVVSANAKFYQTFGVNREETEDTFIYELGNGQWNIPALRKLLEDIIPKNITITDYHVQHVFPSIGEKIMVLNACRITQKVSKKQLILIAIEDQTVIIRAQRLAEDREQWFRNMANDAPVMIWTAALNKERYFFNKTWLDFTGKKLEEEVGTGWTTDAHPDDRERWLATYENAFEMKAPYTNEFRLRRYDGEYRWVLVKATPSYDEQKNFSGFIGTVVDIHDKKMAEEVMRKAAAETARELADVKLLQAISSELIKGENIDGIYSKVVSTAMALMKSDFGSLQILDEEKEELDLVAYNGLHVDSAKHWKIVSAGSGSVCGVALKARHRIIQNDVEKNGFTGEDMKAFRKSKIVSVQSTPLISRSGKVVGMISTHWKEPHEATDREYILLDVLSRQTADLIERIASDKDLLEKDLLLSRITEVTPTLLARNSKDLHYIWVNEASAKMLGYSSDQIAGKPIRDIIGEDAFNIKKPYIDRVLKGERVEYQVEIPYEKAGHRFMHVVYVPERDTAGHVIGWISTINDITERMQAEEKQANLLRMIDSGFDAIIIYDKQHRITHWNTGSEKLYGWTEEEALGQVIHSLFQTKFPKPLEEILDDVDRTGHWEGELIHTKKDGSVITVLSRWTLQRGRNPQEQSVLETNMDITVRKQAEETLRRTVEAAPNALLVVDHGGNIKLVNKSVEALFGYRRDELLGNTVEMLIPERLRKNHPAHRGLFFQSPSVRKMGEGRDLFGLHKSGKEFPIEIGLSPVETSEGLMVIASMIDLTQRKAAEEVLTQSEKRIRNIIASLPQIAFTMKPNGEEEFFNRRWYDYLGIDPEKEPSHEERMSFIHPDDADVYKKWQKKLELGEPWEGEGRLRGKDGEYRWFLSRIIPVKNSAGKIIQWVGTSTDIDEQKKLNEEIQNLLSKEKVARAQTEAQRKKMYDFFMNAPAAIAVLSGPEHVYEFINEAGKQWLKTKGDVIGKRLKDIYPEIISQGIIKTLDEVYRSGKSLHVSEMQVMAELEEKGKLTEGYYNYTLHPYYDENGNVEGIINFAIDVTQQVRARKAIEENAAQVMRSEARARLFIDSNVVGVNVANITTGTVTEANGAFLQLLGYTRSDLESGKINFREYTPEKYQKADETALEEAARKHVSLPYEKEMIRKDGSRVSVLVGRAILDGGRNEMMSVVVDISERKRLEQQKEDFIAIASHELKTPVTSIKGYSELLLDRFRESEDIVSAEMVKKMESQVDKLTTLVIDLLDVTAIGGGKMKLKSETFDIVEAVNESVEAIQQAAKNKIIFNADHGIMVNADRERIGQVVINFISNAIKYSSNEKDIIVSIHSNPDKVFVSVQDFGMGISNELRTKVFDRFFRIQNPETRTYPGIGLGLYIASEIIKQLGGEIGVESKVGEGSTFWFSLPVIKE